MKETEQKGFAIGAAIFAAGAAMLAYFVLCRRLASLLCMLAAITVFAA